MHKHDLFMTLIGAALFCACSGTSSPMDTDSNSGVETGEATTTTTGTATSAESTSSTTQTPADVGPIDGECDPWAQDCPEGYKCMAYAEEGADFFSGDKCTPIAPNPGEAGDPCHAEGGWWTGIDDCGEGLACWNLNQETLEGACVALCTGDPDNAECPDVAEICVFWVPGISHVCQTACDPLTQGCPNAQLCIPNWASGGQEFVCVLDYSMDGGQEFDPCAASNVCDAGLLCWDPSAAVECKQDNGCCIAFCDLDLPVCNGEGAVCTSFYPPGEAPPEFANVGVCTLPG